MTILKAGTFKVSDFRKGIPAMTKVACVLNQNGRCSCGLKLGPNDTQFDHKPALTYRDYDTEAGDFIPPQNDAAYIVAKHPGCHKVASIGPGGERRIHTRGSDRSEPGRLDKIRTKHEGHVAAREIAWPHQGDEPIGKVVSADVSSGKFTVELTERGIDWVKQITTPKPKREKAKTAWPVRKFPKKPKAARKAKSRQRNAP